MKLIDRMTRTAAFATLLAATSLPAVPAQADLLAYEPFDYTSETLAGQDGGIGWAGGWKGNATLTTDATTPVAPDSLVAPPGYVGEPTGGSARGNPLAIYRGLAPTAQIDFGSDGEHYMSFLARRTQDPSTGSYSIFLQSGTESVVSLSVATGGNLSARLAPGAAVGGPQAIGYGTTFLWVVKIVTSAEGLDQVFLQTYASDMDDDLPTAEPETWQVVTSQEDVDSVITQLFIGAGANRTIEIDEIRIGTTWGDVVALPEPASLALLSTGLLMLVSRRRRV